MNKTLISIFFAVILVVGLLAGYFLGSLKTKQFLRAPGINNCDRELSQVKDRLLKWNAISDHASYLSGAVSSVSGNEVYFTTQLVNPFQDEKLKNRVAIISPDTKIYIRSLRTQEEINAALSSFVEEEKTLREELNSANAAIKECYSNGTPDKCVKEYEKQQIAQEKMGELQKRTSSYVMKEGTISDIKPGLSITVSAGKSEPTSSSPAELLNIANEQRFGAVSVEINEVSPKKDEIK